MVVLIFKDNIIRNILRLNYVDREMLCLIIVLNRHRNSIINKSYNLHLKVNKNNKYGHTDFLLLVVEFLRFKNIPDY